MKCGRFWDFLSTPSSFLIGMGSVLDISGNYFSYDPPHKSDERAIQSDWEEIGRDFWTVMRKDISKYSK